MLNNLWKTNFNLLYCHKKKHTFFISDLLDITKKGNARYIFFIGTVCVKWGPNVGFLKETSNNFFFNISNNL